MHEVRYVVCKQHSSNAMRRLYDVTDDVTTFSRRVVFFFQIAMLIPLKASAIQVLMANILQASMLHSL